jgi:Protein of unknown function (DUF664)
MTVPFPSPTDPAASRAEVFRRYLEFFRDRVTAKTRALPAEELRRSRLPSGWTPLELVNHLTYVERRWLQWGFEGVPVPEPWGDQRDGRWHVAPDVTLDGLLAALAAQAAHSDAVIAGGRARRPRRSSGCCSTWCRSTPGTSGTWTSSASWLASTPASEPGPARRRRFPCWCEQVARQGMLDSCPKVM